jgi:hypothetical protein
MRDRGSQLDRIGGVHLDMTGGVDTIGETSVQVVDPGSRPSQVVCVDGRGGSIPIAHGGVVPVLAKRLVAELVQEDIVTAPQFFARRLIGHGQKTETMTKLVEQHADQIDVTGSRVSIDSVIPIRSTETTVVVVDARIEFRRDIRRSGTQVGTVKLIRQGDRIPGVRNRGARKRGADAHRSRASQHR